MEKLKPCPFCGSNDISLIGGSTFRWEKLSCDQCDASCGEVRRMGENHTEIEKEWNTRAVDEKETNNTTE